MFANSKEWHEVSPSISNTTSASISSMICCKSISLDSYQSDISAIQKELIASLVEEFKLVHFKAYPRLQHATHKPGVFRYAIQVITRVRNDTTDHSFPALKLAPDNPWRWFVPSNGDPLAVNSEARADEFDVRKCIENPNYGSRQRNWVEILSSELPDNFVRSTYEVERGVRYACTKGHKIVLNLSVLAPRGMTYRLGPLRDAVSSAQNTRVADVDSDTILDDVDSDTMSDDGNDGDGEPNELNESNVSNVLESDDDNDSLYMEHKSKTTSSNKKTAPRKVSAKKVAGASSGKKATTNSGSGQKPKSGSGQKPKSSSGQKPKSSSGQKPWASSGRKPKSSSGQKPMSGTSSGKKATTTTASGKKATTGVNSGKETTGKAASGQKNVTKSESETKTTITTRSGRKVNIRMGFGQ